ncbi:hypothetical protein BU17DRAFT_96053 [Hysterangium stoloniferum]|nr:hypothetical protein BU17DRAFT_96053 [Hysterangium stoloniferum]
MTVTNNRSPPVIPSTPIRARSPGSPYRPSPRTPSSTTHSNCSPFSTRSHASTASTSLSFFKSPTLSLRNNSICSIADQTDNWRARAQLNGIKVATEGKHAEKGEYMRVYDAIRRPNEPFEKKVAFVNQFSSSLLIQHIDFQAHRNSMSPQFSPVIRRPFSTFNTPSSQNNHELTQARGSLTAPPGPHRRRLFNSSLSTAEPSDCDSLGLLSTALPRSLFENLQHANEPFEIRSSPTSSPSCSVCHKETTESCRMLVLSPCSHIFCPSCFTGTLNIVGEKNMSCMECSSSVDSFHFALYGPSPTSSELLSKMETTFSWPTGRSSHFLPWKATTISERQRETHDIAVLRIDNVPWDVTPPLLEKFIKHPLIGAHVLLDSNGKTLSHAFIQLTLKDARVALRSTQNAILGRGRRARAVTVTLSSHEELMAALYPHWRGKFRNGAPSLDTLDNDQVNDALTNGLLSKDELVSLLNLITTPDSHFLKAASLPFYSLISLLSTFPSDVDSQIFWNFEARDQLYGMTLVAINAIKTRTQEFKEDPELQRKLLLAAFKCEAFTDAQRAVMLSQNHG